MELCLSRRSEANQHKAPRFRSEPTEELKAPGNVWEFGQWTSILVTHSLHSTPVFLIHGSYRAFREQKGYISFLIFQFTWLIFIPPSSSADGEKGGLAGQRETEWPSVIGHTWPGGNWKEVSLREQLHTRVSSGEECASKQSCWALTTEHLAYDEAGDYLNHQIY